MLHLPSFRIIFPANVILFINLLINIVQFDIIFYFWKWAKNDWWGFNTYIDAPVTA